jgi:hypothetical protein
MDQPDAPSLFNIHFSTGTLLASLLWSSVGTGYFIYGKKQQSAPALIGGIAMIAVSFLITDPLWMSVSTIALIAGVYFWSRRG